MLREARGLSQEGWAARLGVGRTTVQRWERGETPPDANAEAALIDLCGELSLFRTFGHELPRGEPLTPERLRELLAAARLQQRSALHPSRSRTEAATSVAATLPTGTITFLFTDVEGSTRLWEQHPQAMRQVMARHDDLLTAVFAQHDGVVVRPRGEGDSLFCVFVRASDAVAAALAGQRALLAEASGAIGPLRVRMGLHTGEADLRAGDYYGSAVNRCARLRAAGHGGQILLSEATARLVRGVLPDGASLRELGEHRLRDLNEPELIHQLSAPGLRDTFPPLQTLTAVPNNLPHQLTSFVGREAELAELAALFAQTRLLTLVGAGGVGKTRLALQLAGAELERFPHGVWFVDLSALSAPELVALAVAAPLGLQEMPGYPLPKALAQALQSRRVLLVLDNCEHLVAACAELVVALLVRCPELHVLVTSREALGVAGEVGWRVPSLSTPAADVGGAPEQAGTLAAFAGPRLFLERARAAEPGFALTDQNAAAVAQICRRLDGIPLAIELAAARVRVLAPQQIAERLDASFGLLTGGSRTAPARQQTLRATIEWSYALLDERERTLLRRLAVFAGGCTLDAVEEVCTDIALLAGDVLDVLTELIDRSLVLVEPRTGGHRFRLLETVRQYAAEKLDAASEEEAVRTRHRDYFAALAAGFESCLRGAGNPQPIYANFDVEQENLRAAMDWSCRPGRENATTLVRLVVDLYTYLNVRGRLGELMRWIEAAAARCDQVPLELRSAFHAAQARELAAQGASDRAVALVERAVALAQETGDAWTIGHALTAQVRVLQLRRDPRAVAIGEEAAVLLRRVGAMHLSLNAVLFTAMAAEATRDLDRAAALFDTVLQTTRQWNRDPTTSGICLLFFARQARRAGDHAEAAARLIETLENWGVESPFHFAHLLEEATKLAVLLHRQEHAVAFAGAGDRQRAAAGAPLLATDRPAYDRAFSAARELLGPAGFEEAWARGQSWPSQQAAAEVTDFLSSVVTRPQPSGAAT
ncbi:MAG TPA: adenylate/guanylate cyclase domain-containing protein [Dehalococcoidia bacterium]|nr:adenylate/guanylate cyclase domain-containing protein [Dehalococcoidia bacterium]